MNTTELYLDLMKRVLTGEIYDDACMLSGRFDPALRRQGMDHPATALTKVGWERLDNIESCIRDVINSGVPGDVVEAGVFRGGAVIFMRACLEALGDSERSVHVCDSFEGFPQERAAIDRGIDFRWDHTYSVESVRANFAKFQLLDDRVRFVEGWFDQSLTTAPIESIAVLRADGDLYTSTKDILNALYPKVSPGGYVIIDDYGDIPGCRQAVSEYRAAHNIRDEIRIVDWTGAYWKKACLSG